MNFILKPKITSCSKLVSPGATFYAFSGQRHSATDFLEEVILCGVKKIVISSDVEINLSLKKKIKEANIFLELKDSLSKKDLAMACAEAYDFPQKKLCIIGITGTKGKTSTTFLTAHLLKELGFKVAFLSTVRNQINDSIYKTNNTTCESDYIYAFLAEALLQDVQYVVMEISAQAITLDRIYGIQFDCVICTNLEPEHREFYNSLDVYYETKLQLKNFLKPKGLFIYNGDDKNIIDRSYLLKDVFTKKINLIKLPNPIENDSIHLILEDERIGYFKCFLKTISHSYNVESRILFGKHNAYNIAFAINALEHLLFDFQSREVEMAIQSFGGIPGRGEFICLSNNIKVCIDYAHSEGSFEVILNTLSKLTNHLIVVFGCGGNRDVHKRPLMGMLADKYAYSIYLTADNSRNENTITIINNIMQGIVNKSKVNVVIDRSDAIREAILNAPFNSIIAILGKGNEEYQIIGNDRYYFSDKKIVQGVALMGSN